MATTVDPERDLGVVPISLPTPFPVGPVNVFLIKRDPPILIDVGLNTDESYEILSDRLGEHGLTYNDLGAIIVTHGHRDHVGLLGRLLRETDTVSYGHPGVRTLGQNIDKHPQARREFFEGILKEFGVPAEVQEEANSLYERFKAFSEPFELDHVVEDEGTALGFKAYFVPGHSASDTLFVDAEQGFTFVGDHILTGTNPNPLLQRPTAPGEPRPKALVRYQQSLRRTRELDLGLCFPGHGGPIEDHVAAVDRILERQDRRAEQVRKLIDGGKGTPYEISRGLFPDLPTPHVHLGLSIAVGHMEVLEERGELTSSHENGILRFHRT